MSGQLIEELGSKIDQTIEAMELMQLQIEELEEKNLQLQQENNLLKTQQGSWEKNLKSMLEKLKNISISTEKSALEMFNSIET